jgi:predicted ATP-binding protein involved in virulence
LRLEPNLNVFIGVNGSGKSTVLDAVVIMLSWVVSRIRSTGVSGRPIMEADITNGKSAASIDLTCLDDNQHIPWPLAKVRKGHRSPEFHSDLSKLNDYTKQTQTKITDSQETIDLPVLIYYPVNVTVVKQKIIGSMQLC